MGELNGGFGEAPTKGEGMVPDPDLFTFDCDLRTCAQCAKRYWDWKERYEQQQEKLKEKNNG